MPSIIEYATVLATMQRAGFRCNYPMSGAFGFPSPEKMAIRAWIGPSDETIRPSLLEFTRSVPPPYEMNLASAAARVWQYLLPGSAWVMPMSHWHFELHDGSRDYLPAALADIAVDPKLLKDRADGSAIEFNHNESESFTQMIGALLGGLRVSDFLIAFPARQVLCMVHHHKQLWWMCEDAAIIPRLDQRLAPPA